MRIGEIDFGRRPVFLAPMEDVTDIGFRRLCKHFGASMVYTEFVSAEALVRDVETSRRKLIISDDERPVGIQIYGRSAEAMSQAARIVERACPDVIDLNFGCPVRKVAQKGGGAGLLRNIPLLLDITRAVVRAVRTPVTVKTRLGWDQGERLIDSLAPQLQDCGIAALTIHGRTRSQMFGGAADWDAISAVRHDPRISIPIIGNGDITTAAQAEAAFERYGVDGVMIGRAAIGQPWIFCSMRHLLDGLPPPFFSPGMKLDILEELLTINIDRLGEQRGILHTRRHLAATPLLKGLPSFRPTRIALLRAATCRDLLHILEHDVRPRLL